MRSLPVVAICFFLLLSVACRKESKISVADKLKPDKMPTMTTNNVATFISDSGIIQYKIVAPVWYVYDRPDTSYWKFPKGVYLRKFDPSFRVISSVAADSAIYFAKQKLWRLDGHVELKRVPKDFFQTSQLFWDERQGRLYSDSFIHIETAAHMLEGYGFVSNDKLTAYRILKPKGVFPSQKMNNPNAVSPGAPASVATEASQAQNAMDPTEVSKSFTPEN